jgi:hypothetical protein
MQEKEKERGRAIGRMPPPERNKLLARMMFGETGEQAQMAFFMLMGAWGVARGRRPGRVDPLVDLHLVMARRQAITSRRLEPERSTKT